VKRGITPRGASIEKEEEKKTQGGGECLTVGLGGVYATTAYQLRASKGGKKERKLNSKPEEGEGGLLILHLPGK